MIYTYKRIDGSTFEWEQRMNDESLKICPESGQPVERIITGGIGTVLPNHMQAAGSKIKHNPDMLPTTLDHYRKKVLKPEYQ